jgi:hypothetical protein
LFLDAGTFRERLQRVEREFSNEPLVGKVLAFIHAGKTRPLMHPLSANAADGAEPGPDKDP